MALNRFDGRLFNQIRKVSIETDSLGYADASVSFSLGQTKVLVSVTLQDGVPHFLKGSKCGWLTAEYAMLPCATQKRTLRESTQAQRNSRSVEISRLIGRSLRTAVDLSLIGERSIIIDCDILQADGGTRVASITAASLALEIAAKRWVNGGILDTNIFREPVAAISAGFVNGEVALDLSYFEDSQAESDFNFILTRSCKLIEIQGTSEKTPLSWQDFENLKNISIDGISELFKICSDFVKNVDCDLRKSEKQIFIERQNENIISRSNNNNLKSNNKNYSCKQGTKQGTPFFSIESRFGVKQK